MRIDRTRQTYGHLVALHDTAKLTKKGERLWAARRTVVRGGKECGRVIQTNRLGQTSASKSCGCLAVPMRDVTGNGFGTGWMGVRLLEDASSVRSGTQVQ